MFGIGSGTEQNATRAGDDAPLVLFLSSSPWSVVFGQHFSGRLIDFQAQAFCRHEQALLGHAYVAARSGGTHQMALIQRPQNAW